MADQLNEEQITVNSIYKQEWVFYNLNIIIRFIIFNL